MRCRYCGEDDGGDAVAHAPRCDGRQGQLELGAPSPPPSRYARALAIYRDTSRDAWHSVLDMLPAVDARIAAFIETRGGATSEECECALGLKHQTVSAQIRHMFEAGFLTTTGEKRPTNSGRAAYVWSLPARRVSCHADQSQA